MPASPEGDITRLPKWAQRLLERQTSTIADQRDTIAALRGEVNTPGAWVDPYREKIPVAPAHERVRFTADIDDNHDWIDVRRVGEDAFEIMADMSFAVFVQAANVIYIKTGVRP